MTIFNSTMLRSLPSLTVSVFLIAHSLNAVAETSSSANGKRAQLQTGQNEKTDRIIATLRSRFPDLKFERVDPSADWPGLYEVISGDEMLYTNADASRLLTGRIFDTESKEDLTARRWNEINKINFEELPFDLAIKTVRGNGSRRVAVFADPDCPYCKQLEENMKGVTDVTIYTFLFPLESLHPGSFRKAVKIWCAKDRAETWANWMLNKAAPTNDDCRDQPVGQLLKLGETLKINSTPTLFFIDGKRHTGSMKGEVLEQRLAMTRAAKVN